METDVLKALLPAFAAGFANQRLMEILDPALESLAGEKRKRISIGVFSVVVGVLFALGGRLRTLEYLGAGYPNYWFSCRSQLGRVRVIILRPRRNIVFQSLPDSLSVMSMAAFLQI